MYTIMFSVMQEYNEIEYFEETIRYFTIKRDGRTMKFRTYAPYAKMLAGKACIAVGKKLYEITVLDSQIKA